MALYETLREAPLGKLKAKTTNELERDLSALQWELKHLHSTIHWIEGLIKLKEAENDT